jgi:hypothetical protein
LIAAMAAAAAAAWLEPAAAAAAAWEEPMVPLTDRERKLMKHAWQQGYHAGWAQPDEWVACPWDNQASTSDPAASVGDPSRKSPSRSSVARKRQKDHSNFMKELNDERFRTVVEPAGAGYAVFLGSGKNPEWLWFDAEDQQKIHSLRESGGRFETSNEDWVVVIGRPTVEQFLNAEKPEGFIHNDVMGCQWNVKSGTRRVIRYMRNTE